MPILMLLAIFFIGYPCAAAEIITGVAASLLCGTLLLVFLTTLVATFWPRRT